MEVKIMDAARIFPSRPPFDQDHILLLSHLDNDPNVQVNFRYVRAYTNTPTTNITDTTTVTATLVTPLDPFLVISKALSNALVHYYPFAGVLRHRRPTDARLELHCAAEQSILLLRATANCSLASVNHLEDPRDPILEQLAPEPDSEADSLSQPFVLQLTIFTCGGFSLGASIHHSLCDGLGSTQFFNAVAEFARGAARPSVEPVWDRLSLLGPREPARAEAPVREVLVLDREFRPYLTPSRGVVRECFHVRDESVERFKRVLYELSEQRFTTFEALGAFIWRNRVKASKVPETEKVKFAYSTNIRNRLNPPLPQGYYGNGCVPIYVQLTANQLVAQPVWKTAELIKRSKRNATDEYVRSYIDFQELHYTEGISVGMEVSGFTDWRHLGHSTVDFGWGGPVAVMPLSRNLLGSQEVCFFLPYCCIGGEGKRYGFQVLVSVAEDGLSDFRSEMEKLEGEFVGHVGINPASNF
ncbi:hypothetical protein Syun_027745 [Stephania yunnanensis]|uniref:Uncharacterized protein n=1 Tax=Stephania yunnanensis TaxID=152371 RepID=A0AAP0HN35_9MAGN